jgi:hypothetical protein
MLRFDTPAARHYLTKTAAGPDLNDFIARFCAEAID